MSRRSDGSQQPAGPVPADGPSNSVSRSNALPMDRLLRLIDNGTRR
jgi:hypothetical protein